MLFIPPFAQATASAATSTAQATQQISGGSPYNPASPLTNVLYVWDTGSADQNGIYLQDAIAVAKAVSTDITIELDAATYNLYGSTTIPKNTNIHGRGRFVSTLNVTRKILGYPADLTIGGSGTSNELSDFSLTSVGGTDISSTNLVLRNVQLPAYTFLSINGTLAVYDSHLVSPSLTFTGGLAVFANSQIDGLTIPALAPTSHLLCLSSYTSSGTILPHACRSRLMITSG